jgi:opacity protein-like surface antigen
MGLKNVLMASAAIVVGLATSDAAQAGGVYGTFTGGLNWTDGVRASGPSTTVETSADMGFVVSVAVGWHLDDVVANGLRVELEGGYRHNHQPGHATINSSSAITQTTSTWSVMGNVWYDFDMGSRLKPYIGGGVGWARNKFIPKPFTTAQTVEDEGFAWQAGGGLNFEVNKDASIGLGYRYMDAGSYGSSLAGADFGDVTHSSVVFTINYNLN